MNTIETTFEIVPADLGLDLVAKNSIEVSFQGFFATAEQWRIKAQSITGPKAARAARLEIKSLRLEVEKKHKEMKADSLLYGRAVDGAKNIFLAMATPIERQLDDIEKEEERREAARIESLREERREILERLEYATHGINLGTLTDEQWNDCHQQAKDALHARQERERLTKEQAEALAKKEAEEREDQRLENIRLKEEAAKREAELIAEREAAEIERQKALAEIAAERAESAKREAAAAKEKAAAEEAARKERENLETARRIAIERIEAIAAEERRLTQEAAALAARKQAEAEATAKALRDAEVKRIADEKAAIKAAADAAKKAACAPDKEKLIEFAAIVRALTVPDVSSEESKAVRAEIAQKVSNFAAWIESQASKI